MNNLNKDSQNVKGFNQTIEKIKRFLTKKSSFIKLGFSEPVNTLCIDAPWGSGKSFFANFLREQSSIAKDYNFIYINTFEYDVFSDPITYILSGIYNKSNGGSQKQTKSDEAFKKIISYVRKNISLSIPYTGINIGFQGIESSLDEFSGFEKVKKTFTEAFNGLDEVVLIFDELDRCKPSYALSLLEIVKHFFSIEINVSFIFLCDKKELSHIVKGMYGESYNGYLYLDRFFHHTIPLTWDEDARHEFVCSLFNGGSLKEKDAVTFLTGEWSTQNHISCRDIIQFRNMYDEITNYRNQGYDSSSNQLFIARFIIFINERYDIYKVSGEGDFCSLVEEMLNEYQNQSDTNFIRNPSALTNSYRFDHELISNIYKSSLPKK
ncbi:KAP family P-loop NTPase fold protein [Cysteiniphilum sp. 6C5]|uniref:KAP family P-loop NTPase fold protein n=1 Tax=unclassified Cysteiniphilum TaxID=2610889 RepID=UPI003F84BF88